MKLAYFRVMCRGYTVGPASKSSITLERVIPLTLFPHTTRIIDEVAPSGCTPDICPLVIALSVSYSTVRLVV